MELAVYGLIALLILGLDIFIAYNFLRYRYKGDKTPVILFLAAVLFVLTSFTTITLYLATATGNKSAVPVNVFS